MDLFFFFFSPLWGKEMTRGNPTGKEKQKSPGKKDLKKDLLCKSCPF